MNGNYAKALDRKIDELQNIISEMRTSLEFYANIYNWEDNNEVYTGEDIVSYSNVSVDTGEMAKNALSLYKKYTENKL